MENIKDSTEMEDVAKKHGRNKFKKVMIIIIIILLGVAISVYFLNKSFQTKVNEHLSNIPGNVGKHFEDQFDQSGGEDKKSYLANYYLSLENGIAADKMYIIKGKDEKLFNDIVKIMNSISPSKTSDMLKIVRDIELKKDLLNSLYNEAAGEQKNEIQYEINKLEKSDTLYAIREIENRSSKDKKYFEELPYIFSHMKEEKAGDILYYLDPELRNSILMTMDNKERSKIELIISKKEMEDKKFRDLSNIYETKTISESFEEIGNDETYSIDQLAKIYKNLNVKRSAEILLNVDNDDFIEQLFTAIRKEEQLDGIDDSITADISEAMRFISDYNKKVKDLVTVYEKMSPASVAKIVEQMMDNDTTVTSLTVDSTPIYDISDEVIIMDVLSNMKKPTLSKIISNMNTKKASQLTEKLANPN